MWHLFQWRVMNSMAPAQEWFRGFCCPSKKNWFHWLFILRWIWQPWTVPSQNCMWKICQKKTAGEKAPSQHCRWKICRWEGVKNLQVRRCHPNTAGGSKAPSQNCRWSMQFGLGTPRMPMCGKLRYSFQCTFILSCARKFLQQKPVLKDIFSPARLRHINVNMLRIFVIEDAFLPWGWPSSFLQSPVLLTLWRSTLWKPNATQWELKKK